MAKKKSATAVVAKQDANDLLSNLVGNSTVKQPATAGKKDFVISPKDEFAIAVEEFAASAVIFDLAENQKNLDGAVLKKLAIEQFVGMWACNGCKPDNPLFKTEHASVRFQVKDQYKVPANTTKEKILAQLPEKLREKMADCIKVEHNLTTKPLDSLMEGTEEEKAAAKAAMQALMTLPEAQRNLILETKPKVVVDAAKMSANLASYCEKSEATMSAVLGILAPVMALSSAKHDQALKVAAERYKAAAEAEAA